MNKLSFAVYYCAIAVSLVSLVGCFGGPGVSVGKVSGMVTEGGQPLSGATVTFFPEGGRPSIGMTDDSGHYELLFTESVQGALVGTHKVNISYGGPPPPGEASREKRTKRILPPTSVDWPDPIEVTSSANTIDFDL
ncbi:carboxypeptidase-like regulatory domain-containing protein [Bremerella sp.]|uniref:carboxypeptidase-like regulatory domain-containing protein n=1 Tax=Bremerella sp. TaxID=2795602 RepID=UPI00391BF9E7